MARKAPKINVTIEALQKRIAELEAALDIERREHCATREYAKTRFELLSLVQQLLIKALELLEKHCAALVVRGDSVLNLLLRETSMDVNELKELPGLEKYLRRKFRQDKGKIEPQIEKTKSDLAEAELELERRQAEATKEMLKKKRTIADNNKKSAEAKNAVSELAASEAEKHPDNAMLKAAAGIANEAEPLTRKTEEIPPGKQADPNRRTAPTQGGISHARGCTCPYCGSTEGFFEQEGPTVFLRTLKKHIEDMLQGTYVKNPVLQCRACGKNHMHIPEEVPVPADLNRTVSQELLFDCARMLTLGMPMNRINALFNSAAMSMSGDTIPRNMHDWITSGLGQPLLKAILKKARKAAEVCADETPFSCLQQAGMSKTKLDDEDAAKQAYLLTITSPASAKYQFAVFNRLKSRSAEAIAGVLGSYEAGTWITDAYAGYDSIIGASAVKIERQSCLAHFTRTVYDALELENMHDAVTNPANREKLAEALGSGTPAYYLLMVTAAISKIYKWEATLKAQEDENPADWMKQVTDCRKAHAEPLMDRIDEIMVKLAERYAVKKGKTWEAALMSPYAKPVVYYMNNKENFRVFLENAYVTPDSSAAERSLRPLCVLRTSCNFKQSPEYMQSMCDWYTLFVTARLNGIERPTQWLNEYGRAIFEHCVNEELNRRSDKGLELSRRFAFDPKDIESFNADAWEPSAYMERKRRS